MKTTGSIFDYIQLGLIASGGDPNGKGQNKGDFPSDKSSNQKVILPMLHNPDGVKQEHLAFSPMMHSPSAFSHMSFQGHLDPGALVYFLKMPGESGGIILGQANDQVNYDQGSGGGGGQNLLGHQYFQDLFDRETGILIPPEIKETNEDGVKVKAIKEKGKKHKHSLLKGLHSHNAIQSTTGYKLEEIKEVPTAKQEFDAIPNQDMMSQMPGDLSSLSSMFQGLMGGMMGGGGGGSGGGAGAGAGAGAGSGTGTTSSANNEITGSVEFFAANSVSMGAGVGANSGQVRVGGETPMDRIKKSIKPELFNAVQSLSVLTQGAAESDTTSFVTSGRVHTPTYLANAEDLLSQVTSLEDVFVVLHRLQHDTSLFGQENLEDAMIEIETAWGNANVMISFAGDIELMYANSNVENTFVETMTSPMSSPGMGSGSGGGGGAGGGGGGGNMFGKSAKIMQDMFKRLPKNNQKESKKMHEKLNQENEFQKLWKFAEKTINGGNPLDPEHFKG